MAGYLGVSNLELWIPHNLEFGDLDKVRNDLEKRNLKVICISTWTQLNLPGDVGKRQNLILQSIKAAKVLDSPIVNTYFGANPDRTPEQAIAAYKENIKPCLELAEKENIVIVLENEFDPTGIDITRKAELVLALVKAVNSRYFRLNFDPCNFYFAGEEPYPFAYNLLKEYVAYIHIKDGMKYHQDLYDDPGDGFLWRDKSGDYICTALGKGSLPYQAFFRQLKEENYTGYYTMEPHVHPSKLKDIFQKNVDNMIQALKQGECR